MFILKDPVIANVLHRLNETGQSVLYGGYIRDSILCIEPQDADIATTLSTNDVLSLFPKGVIRQTTSGHTVIDFQIKKRFIEIVPDIPDVFLKAKQADLNVNSLLYDGHTLIDVNCALPDFNNKLIRDNENRFIECAKSSPTRWIKPFRLISTTGFSLDDKLMQTLQHSLSLISLINETVLQQEAYKIINGKYPVKSLRYLAKTGLISDFIAENEGQLNQSIPFSNSYHFRLVCLSQVTSENTIQDFLKVFRLPVHLITQYAELLNAYKHEDTCNFLLRNQVLYLNHLLQKK